MFKVNTVRFTLDGRALALDFSRPVSQSAATRVMRRDYPDATDLRFSGFYGEPCDRVRDRIRESSAPVR